MNASSPETMLLIYLQKVRISFEQMYGKYEALKLKAREQKLCRMSLLHDKE